MGLFARVSPVGAHASRMAPAVARGGPALQVRQAVWVYHRRPGTRCCPRDGRSGCGNQLSLRPQKAPRQAAGPRPHPGDHPPCPRRGDLPGPVHCREGPPACRRLVQVLPPLAQPAKAGCRRVLLPPQGPDHQAPHADLQGPQVPDHPQHPPHGRGRRPCCCGHPPRVPGRQGPVPEDVGRGVCPLAPPPRRHHLLVRRPGRRARIGDRLCLLLLRPLDHPKYNTLKAAYLYYYTANSVDLEELVRNALIYAKRESFDVFNALSLMDNSSFLENLKFGAGDGTLQYYIYNWNTWQVTPQEQEEGKGIGLVLL